MFLATHQGQHVFTPEFKLCASYVQLFASYVQLSRSYVQLSRSCVQLNQSCVRLCAVLGKLPSASVPPPDPLEGDVVGHPCDPSPFYDILTQGIKRLRFVIFAIHGLPVSWEPKSQWAKNGGT